MNHKINDYFKHKAISNSLLGALFNPKWVKMKINNPDMEDDDKRFFRIGAALDCLLTSPERWEIDFEVVDVVKPFGLMGKFVDCLPAGLTIDSARELYQEAYDKSGYKMAIDKIIPKFWENEDAKGYYLATKGIAKDKTIISKDEYESVTKAKGLIMDNRFIHKFFYNVDINTEILHQVPIYFEYRDEQCKALLDGVLIDHKARTIQPFDLKTIGKSVYDFPISYLQFGYYRQCSFYEIALKSETSPVRKYLDIGFELLDFMFIAVETKVSSSAPAVMYRTSKRDRLMGVTGGYVNGRRYKGIDELIDDYKFHTSNDYWDLPRELLLNKGEVALNVFSNEHPEEHEFSD